MGTWTRRDAVSDIGSEAGEDERSSETSRLLVTSPLTVHVALYIRVPFRVLIIRVPHYIGDLKWDPNLENYPYTFTPKVPT